MSELAIRIHVWMTTAFASMKEERGQDLMEYALWSGLIAIGLIAIGVALYTGIGNALGTGIKYCLDFNTGTTCGPLG
jgi:Flp pilus assembly pilin Flp